MKRGDRKLTLLFVSDGKQMVTRDFDAVTAPMPADPNLNKGLPAVIARGGFMLPRLILRFDTGRLDADRTFLVSGFKLGAKDRIGKIEAQAVEHTIRFGKQAVGPSGRKDVKVLVWINPKSFVPLKRKVFVGDEEGDSFTEVYSEFTIDPSLGPELFELPK